MTDRAEVAVVVPSWNSIGLLPRCLQSLAQQGVELETLVVDNGSTDGTVEYLEREGVPHLALPKNLGYARAMNLGIAEVKAEAVLSLNADTVVEPGAIEALLAALRSDPGLAAVQPRLLQLEEGAGPRDPERARLYSAGQALTRDGRAYEIGAGDEQASYRGQREIFGVCGAACFLRRQAFLQLGGYDERYFSFYEDVDLNVRARIAGRRFEYVPEAVVWHLGNASWTAQAPRPSAWNARLVARNRIATQAKFMPLRALPRILAVEAGALLRAARQRRFRATLRGKLEGLRLLPAMLRDRRRLATEGDLGRAREWLGAGGAGPAPRGR
ncbi:MAG TPA: glycosyltransferase family 2 protein [Solirubrobacterales bacterium]|nr:glycosyltransferase family 2 protein [Solirubrobacterales bacterium]